MLEITMVSSPASFNEKIAAIVETVPPEHLLHIARFCLGTVAESYGRPEHRRANLNYLAAAACAACRLLELQRV